MQGNQKLGAATFVKGVFAKLLSGDNKRWKGPEEQALIPWARQIQADTRDFSVNFEGLQVRNNFIGDKTKVNSQILPWTAPATSAAPAAPAPKPNRGRK